MKDAEGRSPLDVASLSGNPALVRAVSSAMRTQLVSERAPFPLDDTR